VLPAGPRSGEERSEMDVRIIGWISTALLRKRWPGRDGKLNRLGRMIMRWELLEVFAQQLSADDVVAIAASPATPSLVGRGRLSATADSQFTEQHLGGNVARFARVIPFGSDAPPDLYD
jgi:hypothetical protein